MRDEGERHVSSGRETAAQCEAEVVRQEEMQQPASGANKRQMRGGGAGGQETMVRQESQQPAPTMQCKRVVTISTLPVGSRRRSKN